MAIVALVLGLLFGIALGLRDRAPDRTADFQQRYLLLVSVLHAQGVPTSDLRDRLLAVGYTNPSGAVLDAADQLARSPEAVSRQEAAQLRQFAADLPAGTEQPTAEASQPVSPAGPAPTAPALSPTPTDVPVGLVQPSSAGTPVPSATPAPTETPAPPIIATSSGTTTSPERVATPTPRPTPKATAAPAKPGVVAAAGRPAVLRAGASTKTAAVATVPSGAAVMVYGSVRGEPLEPPEATWYHVVYKGKQGYLYANQLKIAR
jgi:hypothetical protein